MKNKFLICILLISGVLAVYSQNNGSNKENENRSGEKYGNALNLLVGFSYGDGRYGQSFPLSINYEFDLAKNFTLAPFISFYSYTNYSPLLNPSKPYKDYYYYRTTVIPVGVKGSYYFDELLLANEKWDFYLAASLGFAYRKTTWSDGYVGPTVALRYTTSGGYLDIHAGAEYHFTSKVGMFLDLSTGVSSFGISIKTR